MEARINHRNFSWECHVCLQERPNYKISVAKHIHIYPSGIEVSQHVRYCNDNPICDYLAKHHDLTGIALLHARDELAEAESHQIAALFAGLSLGLLVAIAIALIAVL